jgi:hypothetical protein|tara:strand:+ start:549 stop:866 length:318 start_codon:yes stop_codon:yes gene_type:complete
MNVTPETPRFRTDEGDFNVSLFSDEGKLKFKLAQKAVTELSDLSDRVMIQREALQSLRQSIIDNECNDDTLIKPERARTATGQYKADDPSTPDVNEAYVQPDKED